MPEPRFLIVRLGSLGDIVHTFPAVAALRATFPAAPIAWLTHPRWESLIASSGLASEIWATETRSVSSIREVVRRIRAAKFTAAIDYQGLWKSAALPLFGGIAKRIGFSSATIREWGVPILYSDRVRCQAIHIAAQNGELSQRAGARHTSAPFALRVAPQDAENVRQLLQQRGLEQYVLLSPGGGWRSKCWPPDRFGELCRRLRNSLGLRCVVNYGPGEDHLVASVISSSGDADPVAYSGSVEELMAVAQNASCVIGGDTGPLHLAVAMGTPSVSIYGPTDPHRNGPFPSFTLLPAQRSASHNFVLRDPAAVRNHSRVAQTDPAILKISVDQVFSATEKLLANCP